MLYYWAGCARRKGKEIEWTKAEIGFRPCFLCKFFSRSPRTHFRHHLTTPKNFRHEKLFGTLLLSPGDRRECASGQSREGEEVPGHEEETRLLLHIACTLYCFKCVTKREGSFFCHLPRIHFIHRFPVRVDGKWYTDVMLRQPDIVLELSGCFFNQHPRNYKQKDVEQ